MPDEEIVDQWMGLTNEEMDKLLESRSLIEHGEGLFETWVSLAFQEPPKDLLGRILWSAGVLGQLLISSLTFPAALGAFLLEEAVQTYGMGAYMLSTAGAYNVLESYLDGYKDFIGISEIAAKNLATINPVTGGAVIIYMEAAKKAQLAFELATQKRLFDQAIKDETQREKELDKMNYSEVRLTTLPSGAEIWINGGNTELLTPETLKKLPVGPTVFEVAKYNTKREEWDVFVFTINLEAGRRKEIHIRIPPGVHGDQELPEVPEEGDEPLLPLWIAAEVEGEYAIDGDTIITSKKERIRILGIDAPEAGRPFFEESKAFMDENISDKALTLQIMTTKPLDVYGRTLAVVKNYKGNVAILLLSAGLARVDILDESPLDRTRYDAAEETAKIRKVGIWSELP